MGFVFSETLARSIRMLCSVVLSIFFNLSSLVFSFDLEFCPASVLPLQPMPFMAGILEDAPGLISCDADDALASALAVTQFSVFARRLSLLTREF